MDSTDTISAIPGSLRRHCSQNIIVTHKRQCWAKCRTRIDSKPRRPLPRLVVQLALRGNGTLHNLTHMSLRFGPTCKVNSCTKVCVLQVARDKMQSNWSTMRIGFCFVSGKWLNIAVFKTFSVVPRVVILVGYMFSNIVRTVRTVSEYILCRRMQHQNKYSGFCYS